jgi:hypothetical protein
MYNTRITNFDFKLKTIQLSGKVFTISDTDSASLADEYGALPEGAQYVRFGISEGYKNEGDSLLVRFDGGEFVPDGGGFSLGMSERIIVPAADVHNVKFSVDGDFVIYAEALKEME